MFKIKVKKNPEYKAVTIDDLHMNDMIVIQGKMFRVSSLVQFERGSNDVRYVDIDGVYNGKSLTINQRLYDGQEFKLVMTAAHAKDRIRS